MTGVGSPKTKSTWPEALPPADTQRPPPRLVRVPFAARRVPGSCGSGCVTRCVPSWTASFPEACVRAGCGTTPQVVDDLDQTEVFKPYAGVSTAILFFTKTDSGGTDEVWFYDVRADGFSLDDKRNPIEANDLPDVIARWSARTTSERDRARTEQSFTVSKADIAAQGYDLSLNRYKEIVHDEVEHRPPLEIIAEIEALEDEISTGLVELKAMLR